MKKWIYYSYWTVLITSVAALFAMAVFCITDVASGEEDLIITTTGNVSLTECNPSAKLDVSGPKYKVTWTVTVSEPVPCQPPNLVPDEFGRVQGSDTMTLQLCYQTITDQHGKVFDSLEEAKAFVKRGEADRRSYVGSWPNPSLDDFKIQEIKE